MVIAATEEEIVTGEEADPAIEPPPVISLSVVSQPGLPRQQVYYPYIAWRLSRTLQVQAHTAIRCCRAVQAAVRLCWSPCWSPFPMT